MVSMRYFLRLGCLLSLAGSIAPLPVAAQAVRDHATGTVRGFHGRETATRRSFEPDAEALNLLKQALAAAGLPGMEDRILLRADDATANAEATIVEIDGRREDVIFYKPSFIREITARSGDYWSLVAIFAHEVGHHVRRHTIVPGRNHEFELEADYQAGFILRRMGSSIDEAQAVYHTFPEAETDTHPSRRLRLASVARGWAEGGQMATPQRSNDEASRCPKGQTRGLAGVCIAADPTRPLERAQMTALSRRESQAIQPGQTFRECDKCPELVMIAPGTLAEVADPARILRINERLAFGRHEVSFAQWDACVEDGGCKHRPDDAGWGRGQRPVVNVSWTDAVREYLPWLSRKTSHAYRLPTEGEWVYAAAGGTVGNYAWGDDHIRGQANCANCGSPWDNRQTAPVASFAPNAFGLHDMHGNVWEWLQDCVAPNYPKLRLDGSAATGESTCFKGLRGASWDQDSSMMQLTSRGRNRSNLRSRSVGFRVVRTLD